MHAKYLIVLLGLPILAYFADASAAPAQSPPNCTDAAHHQFDFWAGDWEVHTPDGEPAGHNHIESVLNGCAIHESWTSAKSAFRGHSYSAYDRRRGVWHQTWIDVTGNLLLLEGGMQDGSMVLSGTRTGKNGPVLDRISWTPRDDGSVRQHWQVSSDAGKHWKTVFDGIYVRTAN